MMENRKVIKRGRNIIVKRKMEKKLKYTESETRNKGLIAQRKEQTEGPRARRKTSKEKETISRKNKGVETRGGITAMRGGK